MRLPDGRRRPVWLTEMGWATHVPHNALGQDFQPNTQRAQAELIARSYLCAIVSGVEPRTFWYDFRNDGDDPLYFEHNMGIVYRDFRPKPAYIAFATLAGVLQGKKLDQAVPVADGTLAYRFVSTQPGGEKAIALWNPSRDATASLEMDAAKVTLVNAIGERREQETVAGPAPGKSRQIEVRLKRGGAHVSAVEREMKQPLVPGASHERVLAACEFRRPDRIPRFDSFWEFPDSWQRAGPRDGLTDIAIWYPDETPLSHPRPAAEGGGRLRLRGGRLGADHAPPAGGLLRRDAPGGDPRAARS